MREMTVLDGVRMFNKRLLNPLMLRLAGRKYWYASVIEHTGRHSGNRYRTPVVTQQTSDGFVIPLPYGVHVDWMRNVLSAGHATVKAHGRAYPVMQPQIISAEVAAPQLRPERRRTFDLFGIKHYLKVKSEPD